MPAGGMFDVGGDGMAGDTEVEEHERTLRPPRENIRQRLLHAQQEPALKQNDRTQCQVQ